MKNILFAVLVSCTMTAWAQDPSKPDDKTLTNPTEQVEPPAGAIKKPTKKQLKSIPKPKDNMGTTTPPATH